MISVIGKLGLCGVLSMSVLSSGCSSQTADETEEALEETGEALQSAANDAAANVRDAADEIEEALPDNEPEGPGLDESEE